MVNMRDSGAILGVDIGFNTGLIFWPPTQLVRKDPCPFGYPEMLTVAHMIF